MKQRIIGVFILVMVPSLCFAPSKLEALRRDPTMILVLSPDQQKSLLLVQSTARVTVLLREYTGVYRICSVPRCPMDGCPQPGLKTSTVSEHIMYKHIVAARKARLRSPGKTTKRVACIQPSSSEVSSLGAQEAASIEPISEPTPIESRDDYNAARPIILTEEDIRSHERFVDTIRNSFYTEYFPQHTKL